MQVVGRTSGAPGSTASFQITYPSHQAGDRTLVYIGGKYNGTTIPTVPTGSGMVRTASVGGGTGSAGADTGTTFGVIFVRQHTASGEANPTFAAGATPPNSWAWIARTIRLDPGETWEDDTAALTDAEQWFQDANTAAPYGVAANSAVPLQPSGGDMVFAFGSVPSDSASGIGSATMTGAGLAGGTVDTTDGYQANPLGDDCAVVAAVWEGFTGTATGTITPNFTLTDGTNHSGIGFVFSLRAIPPEIGMSAGADQSNVEPGSTVTLDSSGSVGVASGRTWSQTAGGAVSLSSTTAVSPTFVAPFTLSGETLTFRVTDDTSSDFDDVNVGVLPASRRVKIGGSMFPVQRRVVSP